MPLHLESGCLTGSSHRRAPSLIFITRPPLHSLSTAHLRVGGRHKQAISPCPATGSAGKGFAPVTDASRDAAEKGEWIEIASRADFKEDKSTMAVTLKDKSVVTVYRHEGRIFCSDVSSTAFKFPMIDARVYSRGSQVVAEVPLDGTTYDLSSGQVLEWCPKNNPLRFVLGTLKGGEKPQPLKMWPTRVDKAGTISCKFFEG